MTALRQLLVFTLAASALADANPCAVPAKPTEEPCTKVTPGPFDNPAVLGGTIIAGLAVAGGIGAGIGVDQVNRQKAAAAAAAAAAKPALRARVSTAPTDIHLTAPALKGATTLEVNSVAGLAAGDNFKIGAGEALEYAKVKSFSSIILDEPLANSYAVDTVLVKVPASEVPATGSSASMEWSGAGSGLWVAVGSFFFFFFCALAAFYCMGSRKKRAKKSAPKKALVEAAPEEAVEVPPLMPLLAPTTGFQYQQPQFQYAPQVQYAQAPQVQYVEQFQAPQVFAQAAMPVSSTYQYAAPTAAPVAGVAPWEAVAFQ